MGKAARIFGISFLAIDLLITLVATGFLIATSFLGVWSIVVIGVGNTLVTLVMFALGAFVNLAAVLAANVATWIASRHATHQHSGSDTCMTVRNVCNVVVSTVHATSIVFWIICAVYGSIKAKQEYNSCVKWDDSECMDLSGFASITAAIPLVLGVSEFLLTSVATYISVVDRAG